MTNQMEAGEREDKAKKEGIIETAKKFIASGMESKTVCEMLGISESDLLLIECKALMTTK